MERTILAGRYRLLSKLGEGGMGAVWRAEHLSLGTPLAIKLIDPSIAESAEALARFKREAQSAAELRSVHVVQIIDYGVDGNVPYIAMELLEGESLAARLERVKLLSPCATAGILAQVAKALTRAHAAGIVHRDLKPENIFLVLEGDEDFAKVLDFGIAKKLHGLSTSSGLRTGTGVMLGTPYYMSPEQVLGKTSIDHRTDIWSLGIIAYQCLTGLRPFDSQTLGALLMAICNDPLPSPSSIGPVPSGFDSWFARCAARDPSDRFASVADATSALKSICNESNDRLSVGFASTSDEETVTNADRGVPQVGTIGDFGQTAIPSSVTIPRVPTRPLRGATVAVGAALVALIGGVVVARTLLEGKAGSAASAIAPRNSSSDDAHRSVTAALPTSASMAIAPAASIRREAVPAIASSKSSLLTGTNKPAPPPRGMVSSTVAPLRRPAPKPEASARPSLPPIRTTKPNYEQAVGI